MKIMESSHITANQENANNPTYNRLDANQPLNMISKREQNTSDTTHTFIVPGGFLGNNLDVYSPGRVGDLGGVLNASG